MPGLLTLYNGTVILRCITVRNTSTILYFTYTVSQKKTPKQYCCSLAVTILANADFHSFILRRLAEEARVCHLASNLLPHYLVKREYSTVIIQLILKPYALCLRLWPSGLLSNF